MQDNSKLTNNNQLPSVDQVVQNVDQVVQNETPEQELARLRAENQALKQATAETGRIKWSEKGCISIYGLGRFPVSLYPFYMNKLLGMIPEIKAFIDANKARYEQSVAQHDQLRKAKNKVVADDLDQDVA